MHTSWGAVGSSLPSSAHPLLARGHLQALHLLLLPARPHPQPVLEPLLRARARWLTLSSGEFLLDPKHSIFIHSYSYLYWFGRGQEGKEWMRMQSWAAKGFILLTIKFFFFQQIKLEIFNCVCWQRENSLSGLLWRPVDPNVTSCSRSPTRDHEKYNCKLFLISRPDPKTDTAARQTSRYWYSGWERNKWLTHLYIFGIQQIIHISEAFILQMWNIPYLNVLLGKDSFR